MSRRNISLVPVLAAFVAASFVAAPPAHAVAFGTADISWDNALLSQFNLVTLGSLTQVTGGGATSIAGRAIVGGDATFVGSPTVCTGSCTGNSTAAVDPSAAKFGALTVFGKLVTPGSNSSNALLSVGAGDVDVNKTSQGNVLLNANSGAGGAAFSINGSAQGLTNIGNAGSIRTTQSTFAGNSYTYNTSNGSVTGYGPAAKVSQSLASVFPFQTSYQTQVKNLATGLANLPGSPRVNAQALTVGSGIFFTANSDYVNGGKSYGVVTTTVSDLSKETSFGGINNGSNDSTFVIVRGDGANYTLPSLNSYAGANKVIFDFVDATTLQFAGNWSGSILAPLANITSQGGTLDGSVIVNNINQTQALYSTNLFTGDLSGLVPEPASIVVIGTGLAALGLVRRRRK